MTSRLQLRSDRPTQVADYPRGSSYGPRVLPCHELVWLLAGSVDVTIGCANGSTRSVHAEPGQVLLLRRGDRDHYRWSDSRPSRHAYVHFQVLEQGPLRPPQEWPRTRVLADLPVVGALCDYLLDLSRDPTPAARERGERALETLVEIFVEGPEPTAPRAELPEVVVRALDHVREVWSQHGMHPLTVADLAAASHVSTGYLHRLFARTCSVTPARFLELVRLQRGAHALLRSDAPVRAVAALCGYRDQFHFSRRFREAYGVAPTVFRDLEAGDPAEPLRAVQLQALAAAVLPTRSDGG